MVGAVKILVPIAGLGVHCYNSQTKHDIKGKFPGEWVLVTGASEGIGR